MSGRALKDADLEQQILRICSPLLSGKSEEFAARVRSWAARRERDEGGPPRNRKDLRAIWEDRIAELRDPDADLTMSDRELLASEIECALRGENAFGKLGRGEQPRAWRERIMLRALDLLREIEKRWPAILEGKAYRLRAQRYDNSGVRLRHLQEADKLEGIARKFNTIAQDCRQRVAARLGISAKDLKAWSVSRSKSHKKKTPR